MRRSTPGIVSLTFAFFTLSCGGGSPTAPSPAPVDLAPSPSPAAPTPTPVPVGAASCPLGKGSLEAQCGRTHSTHLADVDRVITELVQRRPELFDLSDVSGPGLYRVVNVPAYFAGVVQQLQGAGFCAETDGAQNVQLKKGNDLSEKYAILTSDAYVRRGEGSYRDSCRPAIFPVEDIDYIDAIRVHFFSVRCFDDRVAPDNAERILPLGCRGFVSATPKKKDNTDVPPHIHGSEVVWEMLHGEDERLVRVSEYAGQPFNKILDPVNVGNFTMCATVKGIRGCASFEIIP
jgi:hypothetical protein